MSEQETLKGTVRLIDRKFGESDKDYFERATEGTWHKYTYEPSNIQEAIYDNDLSDKFVCVGKKFIFEITELEDISFDCFCNITPYGDKFSFTTSFYNGGTCLSEMLQDELIKWVGE